MSENNNGINITSFHQSGGITAHTVNVGRQPRRMNSDLGETIKQNIPSTTQINITSVMGDGEAFNFATEVMQWCQSNGYSNLSGVDQAIFTQPVFGQQLLKVSSSEFNIIIGTQE